MKIQISKLDVLWSYIGYFFSLFTNILILPFAMKLMTPDELGLWFTYLSIGMLTSIFEFTFYGTISRNITYAWSGASEICAEGVSEIKKTMQPTNYHLLISILVTCNKIFCVIAVIALIILVLFGSFFIGYAAKTIDSFTLSLSWIIFILGIFFNLYYGYWLTALRGVGAIQQSQKSSVISKIVQIVVSLCGLYLGAGIISLCLAFLISGIVLRVLGKRYLFRYEKISEFYKIYFSSISSEEIKQNFSKIWHNSRKVGIVCLSAFVITQTTTLLCSAFLGLEVTASYGLSLQIITVAANVALIYFNAMRPKLTELKVSGIGMKDQFVRLLSLSLTIFVFVYIIELIILVYVGLPVLTLIKSNTALPVEIVLFMGFYLFLEHNHSTFAGIIEMSNTIPYVKSSVFSAISIVILELLFLNFTSFGIYGLLFVQFFVQFCYNNWKWPMVVMRQYELTPVKILKIGIRECCNKIQHVSAIITTKIKKNLLN